MNKIELLTTPLYTVRHTPATLTRNEKYYVKRGDEPEMLPCKDPGEALEIAAFLNEPHRAAELSAMFWREFPGKIDPAK